MTAFKEGQKYLTENGFEKLVVEDFCDLACDTINKCIKGTHDVAFLYGSF